MFPDTGASCSCVLSESVCYLRHGERGLSLCADYRTILCPGPFHLWTLRAWFGALAESPVYEEPISFVLLTLTHFQRCGPPSRPQIWGGSLVHGLRLNEGSTVTVWSLREAAPELTTLGHVSHKEYLSAVAPGWLGAHTLTSSMRTSDQAPIGGHSVILSTSKRDQVLHFRGRLEAVLSIGDRRPSLWFGPRFGRSSYERQPDTPYAASAWPKHSTHLSCESGSSMGPL